MKIQIRRGTFETNSSSTHSLTISSVIEFEKFKAGKLVFDSENEQLIPLEMADRELEDKEGYKIYYTYEEFFNGTFDMETFYQNETTEGGEEIVVFGYYGYS